VQETPSGITKMQENLRAAEVREFRNITSALPDFLAGERTLPPLLLVFWGLELRPL